MKLHKGVVLMVAVLGAFAQGAEVAARPAELTVGSAFNDGMVLQQGCNVPVWGWAEPGEKVSVFFADQKVDAVAGTDGKWRADLRPMTACAVGRTLVVTAKTSQAFSDVLVGEVWWCSGQSNMEITMWGGPRLENRHSGNRDLNGALEAAMTSEPFVRGATVQNLWETTPQKTGPRLQWFPLKGRELRNFSAVAGHYGLILHRALRVPVGVICAAWGATRIEPWISSEGYAAVPKVADYGVRKLMTPPADAVALPEAHRRWLHQQPTVIYNSMVAPYVPMAVKGVLWYQGESNLDSGSVYVSLMHALYATFARAFENPSVPFEFVQIAPFHYDWMEGLGPQAVGQFWELQADFAAEEGNADMAVICDVGERDNIHPLDKRTVALRLVAQALNRAYGWKDVPCEYPVLRRHTVEKGVYTLEFDHVSGWCYRSKQPMRFEIAGPDGKFVLGDVKLDGTVIRVSSPDIPEPKHLRYLWNWDWLGYLTNENGLPLGGFRIRRLKGMV